MDWLSLFFAIELGLIVDGNYMLLDGEEYLYENQQQYYTRLEGGIEILKTFYVMGGIKTVFHKGESYFFMPELSEYDIETGLRYGPLSAGFRHACYHPVEARINDLPDVRWQGAYSEVFVRAEIK